jgi:hypothetical protein
VLGHGQHVADLGHLELAIPVNATVALLKDHQRPGDIEVDEPVRLIVQVQAF